MKLWCIMKEISSGKYRSKTFADDYNMVLIPIEFLILKNLINI